ncbi:MAG: DUF2927 domain-containing protein [Magnetovibrionaceae bacterium]
MTLHLSHRLTFLLAVLLMLLFSGAARADAQKRVDALVAYFDEIVFQTELSHAKAQTVITRWQEGLRISLHGRLSKQIQGFLQAHLSTVRSLTGVPIKQDQANPNITYFFARQHEMTNVKGIDPEIIRRTARGAACYFITFRKPEDRFRRAIIVVNIELPPARVNHCLLEETIQAMGLPNDSNSFRPSIFSDLDMLFEPSRADEILIRTLYDRRLKPGLPRAEALKAIRPIIADWDRQLPIR